METEVKAYPIIFFYFYIYLYSISGKFMCVIACVCVNAKWLQK